ncbi:hypothetical protein ASG57_32640 [Bradyrhizobium sp. Leaf396]|nr:hypothetical protein ASG57_32640 [Bradyrhizobium sp. Leaf396]
MATLTLVSEMRRKEVAIEPHDIFPRPFQERAPIGLVNLPQSHASFFHDPKAILRSGLYLLRIPGR